MNRDTDALKAALENHSVKGYEVVVPMFNEAVILEQGATGPVRHISPEAVKLGSPMVFYKVKAKTPVPFDRWIQQRRFDAVRGHGVVTSRYTLAEWERLYPNHIKTIPDYLMRRLEAGDRLSFADVEHDSLVQRGCINPDGEVSCYTFWSSEVLIDPKQLKKGQLVEYEYQLKDKSEKQFLQGRVIGFMDKHQTALVELFTPLPYLEMPDSIDNELIRKGFYSEGTFAIGYGSYEALEIAQEESGRPLIPDGKWDGDRRIYTLKEFLPLTVIEDVCKEAYGDQPLCVYQSMIMYIVPIMLYDREYSGKWRPLPEHAIESEYVVSYDFEEE